MDLDVRAAAKLLDMTEEKVYELASKGSIPSHRVQEQLRFNRVELLEWASARRRKVVTSVFKRPAAEGASFKLSRALETGGIHRNVAAEDEASALRALAMLIPLPPGVERETIASLFAAAKGSVTAQGGIAIPHARSPVVVPVREPVVVLGFFAKPVAMSKAIDGQPARAAFAIFSSSVRTHLHALSKLASALSDEAFHALVARQAEDAEVLGRLRTVEAAAPSDASAPGSTRPGGTSQ